MTGLAVSMLVSRKGEVPHKARNRDWWRVHLSGFLVAVCLLASVGSVVSMCYGAIAFDVSSVPFPYHPLLSNNHIVQARTSRYSSYYCRSINTRRPTHGYSARSQPTHLYHLRRRFCRYFLRPVQDDIQGKGSKAAERWG